MFYTDDYEYMEFSWKQNYRFREKQMSFSDVWNLAYSIWKKNSADAGKFPALFEN